MKHLSLMPVCDVVYARAITCEKMNEYEEQVLECHKAMEVAIAEPYSVDLLRLRQKLLREEMNELDIEINSLIAELEQSGITQKETRARMMKELV